MNKYKVGDNIKFISEDGRTRYGVINNITPMIITGEVIYDIIDNVHFFNRPINEEQVFLLEEKKNKFKSGDRICFISLSGKTRRGTVKGINPFTNDGKVAYDIKDDEGYEMTIDESNLFSLKDVNTKTNTKNSGDNLEYEGGALRENKVDKIRYDLIPTELLDILALKYTQGAAIYGVDNWRKGDEAFKDGCKSSAFRHFISWFKGEDDEDHLSACTWNMITYKLLNNNK